MIHAIKKIKQGRVIESNKGRRGYLVIREFMSQEIKYEQKNKLREGYSHAVIRKKTGTKNLRYKERESNRYKEPEVGMSSETHSNSGGITTEGRQM